MPHRCEQSRALFPRCSQERRLSVFLGVVRRLEAEGFAVHYEGRGQWDESLTEWPWKMDAVVFAARE